MNEKFLIENQHREQMRAPLYTKLAKLYQILAKFNNRKSVLANCPDPFRRVCIRYQTA